VRVVLIDYGAGNLHSVEKALVAAGVPVLRSADPALASESDALVLPGQGHFGQVMRSFERSGFAPVVADHIANGKPFLGICVGLQLLTRGSEEAPGVAGLGVLDADVRRFPADGVSVPQMGWNQIWPLGASPLLDGVTAGAFVYFANSYYVTFPPGSVPLGAETRYGSTRFLSAVSLGGLHATQFHPEKSQAVGLRVLENFGAVVHAASGPPAVRATP
jgi:imidazole glycerol-phosphate synthase subunit HisH